MLLTQLTTRNHHFQGFFTATLHPKKAPLGLAAAAQIEASVVAQGRQGTEEVVASPWSATGQHGGKIMVDNNG